ncbi:MAG: cytochrome c [Planctomycetaceae bacterium]|nr:cytochrome c [Planctomycetaceae bacterium]
MKNLPYSIAAGPADGYLSQRARPGFPFRKLQASSTLSCPSRKLQRLAVCLTGFCLLTAVTGCGGEDPPATGTTGTETAASSSGQSAGETTAAAPQSAGHSQASTSGTRVEDGRKWIGDIPYDVFYDNPTAVANDSATVAVATPDAGTAPAAGGTAETPAESPPAAGSSSPLQDWKTLIAKQALEDEVSRLQNQLKASLVNVGRYNSTYQQVASDGTALGAMAYIALQHPEGPGWKDNAKYVLSLASTIADSASGRGRPAFEATQLPFEKINTILAGSKPPDLEEPDEIDLSLSVYRSGIMERMRLAQDLMKKDYGREEDWAANRDKVLREASVLAAMTALIASPDYDSAEEMEYRQYVKDMVAACQEIISATKGENFDSYKTALDGVQKACDGCHMGYRFGR